MLGILSEDSNDGPGVDVFCELSGVLDDPGSKVVANKDGVVLRDPGLNSIGDGPNSEWLLVKIVDTCCTSWFSDSL